MKKYPKTIYVFRENEGTEGEFFALSETVESLAVIGEETIVAEYSFVRPIAITARVSVEERK